MSSTYDPAPGCAHHGCLPVDPEPLLTLPNLITLTRTFGSLLLVFAAIGLHRPGLLFAGLAVYWAGDVLDGWVARRTDSETRTGAVLDILSDRLCCGVFYVSYAHLHPDMLLPIGIFLAQFMVIDSVLSLAFLAWPLRSPNYFYLVSPRVYRLNWSPLGKVTNSSLLLLVMITTSSLWLPTAITVAVLAVKMYSLVLVQRLPLPPRLGCAAAVVRVRERPVLAAP